MTNAQTIEQLTAFPQQFGDFQKGFGGTVHRIFGGANHGKLARQHWDMASEHADRDEDHAGSMHASAAAAHELAADTGKAEHVRAAHAASESAHAATSMCRKRAA